jgi:peptidyl-prolyl cis-trans isomerase B (cyclophilin B)
MKKVLPVFALVFMLFALTGSSCEQTKGTDGAQPSASPAPAAQGATTTAAAGSPVAVIETDKGTIKFRFFTADAPNTCDNFIKLADKGFYNGLTFHRVEPNFVIQGGDPNGNGSGGPGYNIKAEFNKNPHLEGSVAMARAADPDSAGSQFYICLAPAPFLDGKYTVFGQVTEGLDVVHKIAIGDKMNKVYIEYK